MPSVREVCLIELSKPISKGDRLTLSGRAYQIESAQSLSDRTRPALSRDEHFGRERINRVAYAHLEPVPDID
jgi:hypothetical protein